jgi:cellulose synthase (UDP-forming)
MNFELEPSVERDLLIRKLFTSGLVGTTTVSASAWSVTAAILRSIWSAPSAVQSGDAGAIADQIATPGKLAAESLVIRPHIGRNRWADLAMQRRTAA